MSKFTAAELRRDFPRLRAFDLCCLCGGHKNRGLVTCWPCFNSERFDEAILDRAEAALLQAARSFALMASARLSKTHTLIDGETIWTVDENGKRLYGVPDYSQPGVAERVRRECDQAEWDANPPRGGLDTLAKMAAANAREDR